MRLSSTPQSRWKRLAVKKHRHKFRFAMAPAESQDLLDHFELDAVVTDQYTVHAKHQIDRAQGRQKTTVEKRWIRGERLGAGGFGDVWLETSVEGDRRETRAVKVISKDAMKRSGIDYTKELLALAKFAKPSYQEEGVFVRFLGWFQTQVNLYISMEYFPLGDLSQHTDDMRSEADIKQITTDLVHGLQIIHQENFAHRDLKPKNVFVVQKPPHAPWWVKIGDFGISKRAVADTALHTQIGTASYTAPEILGYFDTTTLHAGYDNAVDMWSLGCMIYELVTKSKLFPTPSALIGYCEGRSPFPMLSLSRRMSREGTSFLRSLVLPDPRHRLTAQEALADTWVAQVVGSSQGRRSSRSECLDDPGLNAAAAVQHQPAHVGLVDVNLPSSSPGTATERPRIQRPLAEQRVGANRQSSHKPQPPRDQKPFQQNRQQLLNPQPPRTQQHIRDNQQSPHNPQPACAQKSVRDNQQRPQNTKPPRTQKPAPDNQQSSSNPQPPKLILKGLSSKLGGEWKIHLDYSQETRMSLLLPRRQDLTTSLANDLARLELPDKLTALLKELTTEPITRDVEFDSMQGMFYFWHTVILF